MSKSEFLDQKTAASTSSKFLPDDNEDVITYESDGSETSRLEYGIDRSKQGSSFTAFFNVVCVIAGTGALGLPYALAQGGWIGIFILCLSWILSIYTGVLLIRCIYYDNSKRLSSYQEIAYEAFGAIGGWVAFFFTAIILVGVPVLYLLLSGLNLHNVAKGTKSELTFPIWVIICSCIVAVPFVFFKSLKEVGILSCFGMLTTVVVILIVLGVSVKDASNQVDVHHDSVIWNMFPIALSSISFSFGGNPVYLHVESSMRKRTDWNKVLAISLTFCVAIYFLAAVPGYYIYGDAVMSPVYDSLPTGPPKSASIIIITVHLLLATPILLTSFALDVEKLLKINSEHYSFFVEWGLRFFIRGALIVIVCVIAVFVPFFGDFMSLLGAFSNCALIFIFPVMFYFKLFGIRGKPWYEYALGVLTLLMGIVGLIFGTISAIEALNDDFKNKNN